MNELMVVSGQTMTHLQIAEVVGSRPDSVKRTIEKLAVKGVISYTPVVDGIKSANGVIPVIYHVNERNSYVVVAQLSPEFTAKLVDFWQEAKATTVSSIPDFSNPAEAARSWADNYEKLQLAIATKAEIGSRREATSMATASVATKKANKLEIELDKSKNYASVKRMQLLYHGQKFDWRKLKGAILDMETESDVALRIEIFDANYGSVWAYHESVWMEAYSISVGE